MASTRGRARWAYTRVNCAVAFLTHLAGLGLSLPEATQQHLDQWLAAGPGTRYELRDFLVWTARHGHSRDLLIPHRGKAEPEGLDEDVHGELLQRCLHDAALPLDVRAAGALLLLFGQHLTRIVTLTTKHLGTRDGHPTPDPLAAVLTQLAAEPRQDWKGNTPGLWLCPGVRPGTHRSTGPLARALAEHGIPVRPARATALVQLAQDMPPAVLAPLSGLHVITALRWRRRAGTDWTAYLRRPGHRRRDGEGGTGRHRDHGACAFAVVRGQRPAPIRGRAPGGPPAGLVQALEQGHELGGRL